MNRTISKAYPATVKVMTVNTKAVIGWLKDQATDKDADYKWLLAHAEDGVIWGIVHEGKLVTSYEAAPSISPELRAATLCQARLFSEKGEMLVWKDGDGMWQARVIENVTADKATWRESIDENQILWGTTPEPASQKDLSGLFTVMSDGEQGLRHVPPVVVTGEYDIRSRPLRLVVRHYLDEEIVVKNERNGFARIVASRLVKVGIDSSL